MEKKAEKTITLKNTVDLTITVSRSITTIEGDAWEGRPTETIRLESIQYSFVHPQTKKKNVTENALRKLNNNYQFDKEKIKNGVYGEIPGALSLSEESYNIVFAALEEVSKEAMFPEWQEYLDAKKEAEKKEELESAERIVAAGEKELKKCGKLLTRKEVSSWKKNYNNTVNEGGYGYVPERIAIEDYESAKKVIEEANSYKVKNYKIGSKYRTRIAGEYRIVTCTGMIDDCAYCNSITEGFSDMERFIFGDIDELNDGTIKEIVEVNE